MNALISIYLLGIVLILLSMGAMGPPRFWGWVLILIWPLTAVFLFCHTVVERFPR